MTGAVQVKVRLPGTSANLGPAFDVAAVALDLHLEVTAQRAEQFSIHATGRNAEQCGRLEENLILDTYTHALQEARLPVPPLALRVHNQIPLGMGCGSSAAARLAGLALARMLAGLLWSDEELLAYATVLEGHPDNVTACWLGGLTVSAERRSPRQPERFPHVATASLPVPSGWSAAILMPGDPVLTETARGILPTHYDRAAVVENLQRCGLLVAAFATGDGSLLRSAMADRLHQPYRLELCPLLAHADAIAGLPGVLGVALSGAGPALLLILSGAAQQEALETALRGLPGGSALATIFCGFDRRGAILETLSGRGACSGFSATLSKVR